MRIAFLSRVRPCRDVFIQMNEARRGGSNEIVEQARRGKSGAFVTGMSAQVAGKMAGVRRGAKRTSAGHEVSTVWKIVRSSW